jgi:hypothetical protein
MRDLVERFLATSPVKRIQTKAIEDHVIKNLGIQDYWQRGGYLAFADLISQLVQENRLKPIKARKTNGMDPSLFNWYQSIPLQESFSLEEQRELLKLYHPKLDLAYYLQRQEAYRRDKPYLADLDRYFRQFKNSQDMQKGRAVTINERSFEIFHDEKFLASSHGQTLLEAVGLDVSDLNCHHTYEPFFYYQVGSLEQSTQERPLHILIVENKDTFFSFKSLFQEQITTWNGVSFQLLIYGEGRKILRSLSFLGELFFGTIPSGVICHYFGDLDPEGVAIWDELVQTYRPQGLKIVAACFFYVELLKRHGREAPPLRSSQRRHLEAIERFVLQFESSLREALRDLLQSGNYLPQEGLSAALLYELATEVKDPELEC